MVIPDHIAISQFTLAAVVTAANASLGGDTSLPPHSVSKLYFNAETAVKLDSYQAVMGNIQMEVDGEERQAIAWPSWAVSAEVDITPHWEKVVQAVRCHSSQVLKPDEFASMSQRFEPAGWAFATFYRAFSLVNTGRAKEKDLFEGLRPQAVHVEIGT
jgi:LmbE family N-acetylglucosaminyl deacetylase